MASMLSGDAVMEESSALGPGASSTAVAVKLTTAIPAPTTSASTCCSPRPFPSTHRADASPFPSVVAVSGVVSPPSAPAPSAKATLTSGTGSPSASVAVTEMVVEFGPLQPPIRVTLAVRFERTGGFLSTNHLVYATYRPSAEMDG